MRDLIKSVIKQYITEEKRSWIEEHCDNSFDKKEERYFCYAATKSFKNNYQLQESFRNKFKDFITKNKNEISSISLEVLKKESTIAKDGLEELRWVHNNGKLLCPNIKENIIQIYNDLLKGNYVFYMDDKGKYHIVNRLDTNYSALGVMVTEYFKDYDIIYKLWLRNLKSKKSWEVPVNYLINHLLNPYIYNLNDYENKLFNNIEIGSNPLERMFIDLIGSERPEISNKIVNVLTKVREVGFDTERKFLKLLDEYGIEYKNFGKDYGFVDRFLGIDNFVFVDGMWFPTQVKSSEKENTLVDSLGCRGRLIVYPDRNGNFWVNGFEFELFFCGMMKVCKKNPKEIE